jgi:hypothetical protein
MDEPPEGGIKISANRAGCFAICTTLMFAGYGICRLILDWI